jgi:hypothetical protein
MIQQRRYHLSQISLRLEALRANVCQFKHDEFALQQTLRGEQAPESGQVLDQAFDELRESINHTEELLNAVAKVTGESASYSQIQR